MKADLVLTRHAEARSRQRGIPYDAIEIVLTFGRERPSYDDCQVVFMDKSARRQAREVLGRARYAQIEPRLDILVMVKAGDAVVTCMHRKERLHRAA